MESVYYTEYMRANHTLAASPRNLHNRTTDQCGENIQEMSPSKNKKKQKDQVKLPTLQGGGGSPRPRLVLRRISPPGQPPFPQVGLANLW